PAASLRSAARPAEAMAAHLAPHGSKNRLQSAAAAASCRRPLAKVRLWSLKTFAGDHNRTPAGGGWAGWGAVGGGRAGAVGGGGVGGGGVGCVGVGGGSSGWGAVSVRPARRSPRPPRSGRSRVRWRPR